MPEGTLSEPFVGEELVKLELETYSVNLVFQNATLQIEAKFIIKSKYAVLSVIEPEKREGDFGSLWGLIGKKATAVSWGKSIYISFEDDSILEILPSPGQLRGAILGGNSLAYIYEEF